MEFWKNLDSRIKVAAFCLTFISFMLGGAFWAEDRWNQSTGIVLAKEEVKKVEEQTVKTLEQLQKQQEIKDLIQQQQMLEILDKVTVEDESKVLIQEIKEKNLESLKKATEK